MPWPLLPENGGVSIQRLNLESYGNVASNWTRSGSEKDTDRDGMPDAWEYAYALDPTDAADGVFYADDDGLINAAEYSAGTDPRDSGSNLILTISRLKNEKLQLGFLSAEDKLYTIHSSKALGQVWQPLADFAPKTAGIVTYELSPGASQRYFKLEVIHNP